MEKARDLSASYIRHIIKKNIFQSAKILKISSSQNKGVTHDGNTTILDIGVDIGYFLSSINSYGRSLGNGTFDIIDDGHIASIFMGSVGDLTKYINFIRKIISINGFYIGIILNINKLNEMFSEEPLLKMGGHTFEYVNSSLLDNNDVYYVGSQISSISGMEINIDNRITTIMSLSDFAILCGQFNLKLIPRAQHLRESEAYSAYDLFVFRHVAES